MIPYLLNAALMLSGCLCFYKILLRKETFYKLNRIVLMGCLVLSFSLPLIPVPQQWSFRKAEEKTSFIIPVLSPENDNSIQPSFPASSSGAVTSAEKTATRAAPSLSTFQKISNWLIYLYWFGVAAFAVNFLLQFVLLLYKAYRNPAIIDGKFRIVELDTNEAPSSFGNIIFINPSKYDWETYNQILLHEKIHIRQQHTLDILIAELVLIFQWFNPFAWIYRKEIESNLEFLTDDQLLQSSEVDKSSYQMSLLKVSTPQLPLNLSTNYNQSLLKKRIVMMNSKKSNIHTTWKYGFIFPMLILLVTLLNEPAVFGQNSKSAEPQKKDVVKKSNGMETEGAWFATIKGDKVHIQFKRDDDDDSHSSNTSTFLLTDLGTLPSDKAGDFKVTREAGTMLFNGKFEGNQGMGSYKFTADKAYVDHMTNEGIAGLSDNDEMAFFFIDIKKSYLQMLKNNGYSKIGKHDLIPMAALKIDEPYIRSWKDNGYKDIAIRDLIPLHSLKIDKAYVDDIRKAGYKDVSVHQLISFKSQGIDGKYISEIRKQNQVEGKGESDPSANDIIAFKSLDVDAEYVKSLKDAGYKDIPASQLIAMKSQHITPEYIKSFEAVGFDDIPVQDLIAIKSLQITPEFIKEFKALGYTNLKLSDLVPLKSLHITGDYIKQFEAIGYKNIPIRDLIPMKSQQITPEFIKGLNDLGFKSIPTEDLIAAKATGVTPAFISSMKEKGHNLKTIQKYIVLKNVLE